MVAMILITSGNTRLFDWIMLDYSFLWPGLVSIIYVFYRPQLLL